MDNRKKLIILAISAGVVILIWWWIFLFQSILDKNDTTLTADVNGPAVYTGQEWLTPLPSHETEGTDTSPAETAPIDADKPDPSISIETPVSMDEQDNFSTIQIIVPPFIDEAVLQSLRKEIFKTKKVTANIQVPRTRHTYEEMIKEQYATPSVDIIMLPTDRINSFDQRGIHIPLKKPLAPLFHPLFEPLINHSEATFIPYALDPYVTLHQQNINFTSTPISLARIQNTLLTLTTQPNTVPFLFGITKADITLLSQDKQAYPGYLSLLIRFIEQAKILRNTYVIEFFLDTSPRNTVKFLKQVKGISEQEPRCTAFPVVCHLAHKKSSIAFGKLSDIDQWYITFPEAMKDTPFTFSNFPVSKWYPVTGWWFMVSKKSSYLDESGARIQGYIQTALEKNAPLWGTIFSAYNYRFQQQKRETQYIPLKLVFSEFDLVIWSLEDQDFHLHDTQLLPMLEGTYSKSIYLRESIAQDEEG